MLERCSGIYLSRSFYRWRRWVFSQAVFVCILYLQLVLLVNTFLLSWLYHVAPGLVINGVKRIIYCYVFLPRVLNFTKTKHGLSFQVNCATKENLQRTTQPLNISVHIFHTVLYKFPTVLSREVVCKSRGSLVSNHFLYSCNLNVWYCKEILDASHSQKGSKDECDRLHKMGFLDTLCGHVYLICVWSLFY